MPLTISAQAGLISQYDYFDKKIASINLTTYYILKNGEFAYNKSYSNGYPYGAIKRLDLFEEGALSSLYICFCVSNIDSNYLCYYFDSNKWNYEVKIISGEGVRNHGLLNLTPSDFFNIRIFKPHTLEEQCKISKFLELIYAKEKIINRKISILKKYKEGIFRIIKRNTVNYIKLGDFCDLYQPKTISQNLLKKNEKYPVYGANGIIGYYNDYNHETSQVIVGCRGNCGSIQLTNTKSWINGNAMVIKPLNNIKLIYLYYLIHTIRFDKIIEKSSVPQITRDKMKTIKIPANFDNKILDMLILLDKKIELLQKEVKVLKKIKLQLLNVLFI